MVKKSAVAEINRSKGKRGGRRPGAGRPKGSGNPDLRRTGTTIYGDRRFWEYVDLWAPEGNRSDCFAEMVERCRAFWPHGPSSSSLNP